MCGQFQTVAKNVVRHLHLMYFQEFTFTRRFWWLLYQKWYLAHFSKKTLLFCIKSSRQIPCYCQWDSVFKQHMTHMSDPDCEKRIFQSRRWKAYI